jgi:hypothetical protein
VAACPRQPREGTLPNQYGAEKKTIGELLSLTAPPIAVPEWQRSYSWETPQIELFWQDLVFFSEQYPEDTISEQEYFFGSIVLVNTPHAHLLLDGQQRLATATILLSVIRDQLSAYNRDAATRLAERYISAYDDATEENAYKLTLNLYDNTFFRGEIQSPQDVPASPVPQLESHKLIKKAREYFEARFAERELELGEGRPVFQWALRMSRVLTNHASVVVVSSFDEDNAASVFETLNDRGIGLSTPDLLRNLLLRRADDEGDREQIIEHWRTILSLEGEAKVDEFLRHYWLSHRGDLKTRSLYRVMKQWIIDDDVNSLTLSAGLADAAVRYRDLVTARDDDLTSQRALEAISALGAKALLPAVLSAYDVGTVEERRSLIEALIVLFLRHNVIANRESTSLESVVYRVARDLRQDRDFGAALTQLRELAPTDQEFVAQFGRATIARRASARYILRELEHRKRRTQEVQVEVPERVHVEHIYPQNPRDEKWPNHNAVINRIGNLTLLGAPLNVAIRNADFDTKKRDGYAGSDLLLTQELLAYDAWDSGAIDQRQDELSQHVLGIWSFPPDT